MDERLVLLSVEVSDRLFHRKYVLHSHLVSNGVRYDTPSWLWEEESPDCPPAGGIVGSLPPAYAWDLRRAWEVVEELRRQGWLVVIKMMPEGFPFRGEHESEKWHAVCCVELTWMPLSTNEDCRRAIHLNPFAMADSMPEAVCKAALDAIRLVERYG